MLYTMFVCDIHPNIRDNITDNISDRHRCTKIWRNQIYFAKFLLHLFYGCLYGISWIWNEFTQHRLPSSSKHMWTKTTLFLILLNPKFVWNWVDFVRDYIDGLTQDCSNTSVLAMVLLQSCSKPSTYPHHLHIVLTLLQCFFTKFVC